MDLSESLVYVEEDGIRPETVQMKHFLHKKQLEPEDIKSFIELHNPDDGIPYDRKKGILNRIGVTFTTLWWFDVLGMIEKSIAVSASKYNITIQYYDSSWDENPLINWYNPPFWARLGFH